MKIAHLANACTNVWQSSYTRTVKIAIFTSYLALVLRSWLHHKFNRVEGTYQTRFYKWKINFSNFSELVGLIEEIFIREVYRPQHPPTVIFDCGSHIGISLLYFQFKYPNARISAFEPSEENFRLLKVNISENQLTGVTLHRSALGREEMLTKLYRRVNTSSTVNFSITKIQNASVEIVPAQRLSSLLPERLSFVKMDVEGAEQEIIDDLETSDSLNRIGEIIIEIHPALISGSKEKLIQKIADNGFIQLNKIVGDSMDMILHFVRK